MTIDIYGLNSNISKYSIFSFDTNKYPNVTQGWDYWGLFGSYLYIIYQVVLENEEIQTRMLLFNLFSQINLLETIDYSDPYIIINTNNYPIMIKSNNLLGYDLLMLNSNRKMDHYKFELVSNNFNIFGILGWIGSLVNDVLTLIGGNSGYELELEYLNTFPYGITSSTLKSESMGNVANSVLSTNAFPIFVDSVDNSSGNFQIDTNGILVFLRLNKIIKTNLNNNNYICYFYDYINNVNYATDGSILVSISKYDEVSYLDVYSILSGNAKLFYGMINNLFVFGGYLYDLNLLLKGTLPDNISNLGSIFCNQEIGYGFDYPTKITRFALIDNKWIIGKPLNVPNSIIDIYNSGETFNIGITFQNNGTVLMYGTIAFTNIIYIYKISPEFLYVTMFPSISSGKICGC